VGKPETVLDVERLSVRFGKTRILADLSFRLTRGASLAVIGPNGAGKTVLFRALIGAIPFDGAVRWARGVRVGYVPQKLDLQRDVPITGSDFLKAHAAIARRSVRDTNSILESVGLTLETAARPIGVLSGGQFQRLLVAFALVGEPDVLLLDEPTAGVDEPGQERLNELIHRLQQKRGLTVLFISHELSVVYRYATDLLCLNRERFWTGSPRTILTPDLLAEIYGTPLEYHIHER
jgi:zinc transport system ATP-binding protein